MIRYLVVGDQHTSDSPPAGRTEDYPMQIIEKLLECWRIASEQKCQFVLLKGDLFHKFRGWVIAYRMLSELMRVFRAAPCEVYAIAGNHDLSSAGLSSLKSMPLGVLIEAGVIRWLDQPVYHFEGDDHMLLIPRNWEPYIDRTPNYFKLTKAEAKQVEELGEDGYVVMVAHASIFPPGHNPPYPHHKVEDLPTGMLDILHCGHIHDDLGVYKCASGCIFENVGAITRDDRSPSSLKRTPQVALVELGGGEIEITPIPLQSARPASEVFLEMPEKHEREVSDFAESLAEGLELEETPLDELIARLTKDDPPEVVDRLRRYLEEANE